MSRFSTNDGETSGTICVPPASGDPAQGRAAGGDPALDGEELAVGTELDQYIIREMIGRGGCGTVYAAEHGVHATQVAIKVLRRSLASSSNQVRRFVQEAMALRLIDHPGIVRVYDTGYLHDGRPYFVMELLEGRSLASMLGERGRISPAESLEILGPVCEMLQLAHEAGIVHRDIKASNIMVTGGPEDRTIKLLDFGLAKLVNTEQSASMQTSVGVVLGTLHSMSPEQIMGGTVDERTDIYALGALLHRLLTGRHPFEDIDGQRVARMHLNAPPPQPSQLAPVSLALDAVVRRSMDKDPSLRFPSADAFLAALRDAVGSRSADTRRPGEAVAIYVEGRVAAGLDMDDQLFAVLMQALDRAEGVFARSGFQVLWQTTNAILAARLISPSPGSGTKRAGISADLDPAVPSGSEQSGAEVGDGFPGAPETAAGTVFSDGESEKDSQYNGLEDAVGVAATLRRSLADLTHKDSRMHINICIHRDRAVVKTWADQTEIDGGSIADVDRWAPRREIEGIGVTPEWWGARDENSALATEVALVRL